MHDGQIWNNSVVNPATLLIPTISVGFWTLLNGLAVTCDTEYFCMMCSYGWQAGWLAVTFFAAWWLVFFIWDFCHKKETVEDRTIVPLPSFLEFSTARRGLNVISADEAIDHFNDKAGKTIVTVDAIVGFSLIIFSLTLTLFIANSGELTGVYEHLTKAILGLQIVAIVAFVVGMDHLDTSMNRFVDCSVLARFRLTRHYYRKGIYSYYRGLVILLFSALLSVMLADPWIAVIGTTAFALLGYRYWFGPPKVDRLWVSVETVDDVDGNNTENEDANRPPDVETAVNHEAIEAANPKEDAVGDGKDHVGD